MAALLVTFMAGLMALWLVVILLVLSVSGEYGNCRQSNPSTNGGLRSILHGHPI